MLEDNQSNPQPSPTQPTSQGINWKNILIGVIIGAVVFGGGGFLVYNAYQPKKEEPEQTTTTTTKTATPSSETATPSAKKNETTSWKTYTNKQFGYQIKYPKNTTYTESEEKIKGWGQVLVLIPYGEVNHTLNFTFERGKESVNLLGNKGITVSIISVKKLDNTTLYDPKVLAESFKDVAEGESKLSEINISGVTGYKIEITNNDDFVYWILFKGKLDSAHTILISTDLDNKKLIETMLASFELL